jgi:VIT1/CCC1 family predicted Fe2+/Mn2+ transporter
MKRVLDPIDRVSEVLFGLIMVLTFTGSLSVAEAGHAEVREMLVGALGCNVAWGIIDALLYLLACLADKGRGLVALQSVQRTTDAEEGRRIVADALPPVVASVLEPSQLEAMRQRLAQLPEPSGPARLDKDDWRGGLGVFLLVFLSTLPVAIPFVFVRDPYTALRISNGIAVALLFVSGYVVGRLTRYHPWATGLAMVLLGSAVVAMTMALGG